MGIPKAYRADRISLPWDQTRVVVSPIFLIPHESCGSCMVAHLEADNLHGACSGRAPAIAQPSWFGSMAVFDN